MLMLFVYRVLLLGSLSLSVALLCRSFTPRLSLARWSWMFFGLFSVTAGGPFLAPGAVGLWYGLVPPQRQRAVVRRLAAPPSAAVVAPRLILLQGIPRSGKSAFAVNLQRDLDAVLVAYDAIRAEINGNAADQATKDLVVQTARDRARVALVAGTTVIVDGTHAKREWVAGWEDLSQTLAVPLEMMRVVCPLDEAMRRNAHCARRVPTRVLVNMHRWLAAFDDRGLSIQTVQIESAH